MHLCDLSYHNTNNQGSPLTFSKRIHLNVNNDKLRRRCFRFSYRSVVVIVFCSGIDLNYSNKTNCFCHLCGLTKKLSGLLHQIRRFSYRRLDTLFHYFKQVPFSGFQRGRRFFRSCVEP